VSTPRPVDADDAITLQIPETWSPISLNRLAWMELPKSNGDEANELLADLLDRLAPVAAALRLRSAAAGIYVVADEVTVASVVVGWWTGIDSRAATEADLETMRAAVSTRTAPATIIALPIGPAVRWSAIDNTDTIESITVGFAVPVPHAASAVLLTFAASGTHPKALAAYFDTYAQTLAVGNSVDVTVGRATR
jgi:hypothetical protein